MPKEKSNEETREQLIAKHMVQEIGTVPVMHMQAEANYENMSWLLLALQQAHTKIEIRMKKKASRLDALNNKSGKKARKLISALENLNQERIWYGWAFYDVMFKMKELWFYEQLLEDENFKHLIHGWEEIDLSVFEEKQFKANQEKFGDVIWQIREQGKTWSGNVDDDWVDFSALQWGEVWDVW